MSSIAPAPPEPNANNAATTTTTTSKQPPPPPRTNSRTKSSSQHRSTKSSSDAAAVAATASSLEGCFAVEDDVLLQSISQKQFALLQPTITMTLYIPTCCVGAVIGRRGQNIALIQKLASQASTTSHPVRVSVVGSSSSASASSNNTNTNQTTQMNSGDNSNSSNNNNTSNTAANASATATASASATTDAGAATSSSTSSSLPYTYSDLDFSDPNWTPVVIRADPKAAFTAAHKLEESVLAAHYNMDQVVVDVPLSRQKHAAIVGKRGLVLANLSADTNVRIMVPNKELRHDVVQLEGDLVQVKLCLERLLQIASKVSSSSLTPPTAAAATTTTPSTNTSTTTTTTTVPSSTSNNAKSSNGEHIQTIVVDQVPSQTKLRGLSRKTDTIIRKKRLDSTTTSTDNGTSNSGGGWQLTVSGKSAEQVQVAIQLLQKAVETKATNNTATEGSTPTTTHHAPPPPSTFSSSSSSTQQQQQSARRGKTRGGRGGATKRGGGGGGGGGGGASNNKLSPALVGSNKDGNSST